ncbi:MAG TPA: hypothetical protein VGP25_03490 [Gemmatimonadaceae bacterium]|nr:hypothetical protein [Gemmatimonadaceae bacterium]
MDVGKGLRVEVIREGMYEAGQRCLAVGACHDIAVIDVNGFPLHLAGNRDDMHRLVVIEQPWSDVVSLARDAGNVAAVVDRIRDDLDASQRERVDLLRHHVEPKTASVRKSGDDHAVIDISGPGKGAIDERVQIEVRAVSPERGPRTHIGADPPCDVFWAR